MKKRVISMILALALCLGLMPVVPVAALDETGIWFDQVNSEGAMEEGEQSWSADRFNGSTTDVVWNGEVIYVIGKDQNVTIDGNLTIDGSGLKYLILFENATLTIKGALILKRDGLSILGHTASLQPGDIGQIVIENSKNPSGAAIRSGSDSGEPRTISLCGGKLTAKGGQYGAVDHVTLWKQREVLKATLGEELLSFEAWADETVTFPDEKDLVIEWCRHSNNDEQEYIADADSEDGGHMHHQHCTACGFAWDSEEYDLVPLTYDETTHTKGCDLCENYKKEPEAHKWVKEDGEVFPTENGKGHTSSMCSVCGYTSGEGEAHDYDEKGRCTVCKFKPVFEDSEDNLYGYDGSYSIDALNEAIANGVTSFKLVNFAQGEGADTTTVEASFSLETEAEVTLDMNGKTLKYGSGDSTLTVSKGKLTVINSADDIITIAQTGGSQEMIKSAVKVTGGTLIFDDKLTATGASSKPAVEVTGGTLRLKAGDVLNGGVSVASGTVVDLLGENLAFAKKDNTSTIVNGDVKSISENVMVVAHTHDFKPGVDGKYTCACGYTCAHSSFTNGKCDICGYACPHPSDKVSESNGKYTCDVCKEQMVAKIEVDGKTTYSTDFKSAMRNATNGTKITLLADVSILGRTGISGDNTTVTLDLNEHKITSGWLDVGGNDTNGTYTTCTLKIIGKGSYEPPMYGGIITVDVKATLDLSEWEGGTISSINISDNSNYEAATREAAVIVGPKAGTIGNLSFGNNQLGKLKKTKLSGGSFNEIWAANHQPVKLGELLADGYAFQNGDGSYVEYGTTLKDASISNVRVVKCTNHVDADDNKLCDYCNTDLSSGMVASLTTGDKTYFYTDLPAAVAAANDKGGTVTLLDNVTLSGTLAVGNIGAVKDITLDLNGHTITDNGTPSGSGKDRLIQIYTSGTVTICDGSQAQSGTIESKVPGGYPVCLSDGTLTIEGGTFKGDQYALEANISPELTIKGGTFKGGILSYTRSNTISGGTFLGAVGVKYTTKISGGSFASLISDRSIGSLLADGYTFRSTAVDGTWLTDAQLAGKTANNITAVEAPITSVTLTSDAENNTVQYGTPVTLTASYETAAGVSSCTVKWYEIGYGAPTELSGGELTGLSVGTHKYRVVATADGYSRSAEITITVNKATQSATVSMANYTYNETPSTPELTDRTGDEKAPVTYYYIAADGAGAAQEWKDIGPTTLDAGTYKMQARIAETTNYFGYDTQWCEFKVEKATPDYTKPTGLTAKYGQKLSEITLPEGWTWTEDADTSFDTLGRVTYKAKFTPDDTTNYEIVENISVEVKVEPADGSVLATVELSQKFTDDSEHTYTPDWTGLPEGQTWSYNSEASIQLPTHTFTADGKTLTYAITGGKADDVITITLKAQCSNYTDFTIVLRITLTERDPQPDFKFDTKETTVTYGDESFTLAATGAQTSVTYVSDNPSVATVDKDTGKVTIVGAGEATITATAAQTNEFDGATASCKLTVKKAVVTITALDRRVYVGGKAPDLTNPAQDTDYTVSGLLGEDKLNIEPTLKYVDAEGNEVAPDMTKTGEYIIRASGAEASANYTIEYADGKLSIVRRPASGGSNTPVYPVRTPDKTENGTISTDPKSAEKGETVTITVKPDTGYELGDLIVTDKNGDRVNVINRGNGKFTFVMPDGGVTIRASFVKESGTSPFRDVPVTAYYYKAVSWAAKNDITGGIGNGLFGPELGCTRAQFVTFLWRACGSPAPKALSKFTDVPADAYYAKAVAWAVENGITDGTSPTTFSPNATCTRAHAVTFLWRALGKPSGSSAAFTDVPSGAYYAKAVAWAAENDVTTGVGGGRFASDDTCTRAQIVTFLYRCMR